MGVSAQVREKLRSMDARTFSYSTEEQVDFASDFTSPMISFSNPGTGKTHSIVRGIMLAQTVYGVPGADINAMSFTVASTTELQHRYKTACKQADIAATASFNTFHGVCRAMLLEGFPDFKITQDSGTTEELQSFQNMIQGFDIKSDDMYYVKQVYQTIDKLNQAMVFHPDNVERHYDFQKLNIELEDFQQMRKKLFWNKLMSRSIPRGDLPLYALYALCKKEAVRAKFEGGYKIMIVDEFQDMTKLYLVVLSLISRNLIVIGDMKQQIYGFNGANPYISDLYKQIFPEARSINLTQSFRCKDEIADFATRVYRPNDRNTEQFKGVGPGGSVKVQSAKDLDLPAIVKSIKKDIDTAYETGKVRDTMFLFRNNYSTMPILEELFKQGVPFRAQKFKMVMEMPVFKEVSMYADIASDPTNMEAFKNIPYIFPQFEKYKSAPWTNPVYEAANIINERNNEKVSIFDLKMQWNSSSAEILGVLKKVHMRMLKNCLCATVFTLILPLYEKYCIKGKWWTLDNTLEYYMSMIAPVVNTKTYQQMVKDEFAKRNSNINAFKLNQGVKCYTMHGSKGLEADDVYIVDADAGVIPNDKKMKQIIKAGCEFEAAQMLREDRNLLYVAITRAKENVVITYNSKLTPLIESPDDNEYSYLDDIYATSPKDFDDFKYFRYVTSIKESVGKASRLVGDVASKQQDASDDEDVAVFSGATGLEMI